MVGEISKKFLVKDYLDHNRSKTKLQLNNLEEEKMNVYY